MFWGEKCPGGEETAKEPQEYALVLVDERDALLRPASHPKGMAARMSSYRRDFSVFFLCARMAMALMY